jgi:hypothetical protein
MLQTQGTKANPNLLFFLPKMEDLQLDQLVRKELAKQGITKESEVNSVIEQAEAQYEHRQKVEEARKEIRRLMAIKAEGGTKRLKQVGFRKWQEAFYPSVKRYMEKQEEKATK